MVTFLTVRNGLLETVNENDHSRLQGFLARAIRVGTRGVGEALLLNPTSASHTVTLFAVPLRRTTERVSTSPPTVALYLADSATYDLPPVSVLMNLDSLTRTEAMLAIHLLAGRGLQRAAEHLKISPNTAKSHLKQIFEKTGTRYTPTPGESEKPPCQASRL